MARIDKISGTQENLFRLGDGVANNKTLYANNGAANPPAQRWNQTAGYWEFSNDGTTWYPLTGAGSTTPANVGVAAAGTSALASRQDHVHALPASGVVAQSYAGLTVNAQGIVTAISRALWNSPVESAKNNGVAVSAVANQVRGFAFSPTTARRIVGVRFLWGTQTANIRCKLWSASGSVLRATASDVACTNGAITYYTATFSTPYTPVPYDSMAVSMFETTGTYVIGVGAWPPWAIATSYISPQLLSPDASLRLVAGNQTCFSTGTGDVFPNSGATTVTYPLEPIFEGA